MHRSLSACGFVFLFALLHGCGGGESSPAPVPPPAAPVWSGWTAAGTQVLTRGESTFDFFVDASENLLTVERRPANGGSYFLRRYSAASGWDAGVPVDAAGKLCAAARFAYRDGYLLETVNGYLLYDKATGWCNVPGLPAADGPATSLKITAAADRSVIAARIVGAPSTTSKLETFELSGSSWVLKSTLTIAPVQPINTSGFTLGKWSTATAHVFKDGVLAWAQYEMLPTAGCLPQPGAPCALLESVQLAGDGGNGQVTQSAPCVLGTDCFDWRVLADGSLIGYAARSSVYRYYRRENKAWVSTINGESPQPGLNDVKLDPVFVHSMQSAVFTSACAAGSGLCEGRELARFIKPDGSSRPAESAGLRGRISGWGELALLRNSGPWQIAYRLGAREYTEPVTLAAETYEPISVLAGNLQQYVVWQSTNAGTGQLEMSVSTRAFK